MSTEPTKDRLHREYRAIQNGRGLEAPAVSAIMRLAQKYKLPCQRIREILEKPGVLIPLACVSESPDCHGTVRRTVDPYVAEIFGRRKPTVLCEFHYTESALDI